MSEDYVEQILDQWRRERPEVDVTGMAVIGRVSRLATALGEHLRPVFAEHGLEDWEFDVLATVRRGGAPFRMTAGELVKSTMVTSGAMTNRIDRLEKRGYVERSRDDADGRVVWVSLTDAGRDVIDRALPAHAENEVALVSALTTDEREALIALTTKFSASLAARDAEDAPPRR